MTRNPVRWGILSTANIGVAKVIPGMLKSKELEIVAIGSRDLARGQAAAKQLGIPKAYGSYAELLADPSIEAIYNPLPNHLHVPLTLEAARAGKHVLCEKPIAITADEARQLEAAPKGVHIAEAFMVRHHPQWIMARDVVRSGQIGRPVAIQVLFSYKLLDPDNVRNKADIGGGGLLDIGCYPMTGARYIFECEPSRVIALIDRDPVMKVDRTASALADFGQGRQLSFTIGTQMMSYQRVHIVGTDGRFEIDIPFNAPQTGTTLVRKHTLGGEEQTITIPPADQYQLQAEAFGRVVRGEEPLVWGVPDAIANMRVQDAFIRSEASNRWESV
jgi:predicted dehydrogenase